MSEVRAVELSGGPRERGRQHGESLRAEIRDLHGAFLELMTAPDGDAPAVPEADVRAYAREHLPHIRHGAPDLLVEMQGIAEGADVDFDTILALTCVAEIRRLRVPSVRSAVHGSRGCTLFGVQDGPAGARAVYIGQTYDIEPLWTPIVFRIVPGNGEPEQLVVGHAGIMAAFGINAAGIAFVGSAILVADQRPGLPAPVVGRLILNRRRLGAAAEAVIEARRTVGIHYLIAAPFGIVDLETSATRHAIAYVEDEAFACANHIRSPDLVDLGLGTYGRGTIVREGRMRQLLAAGGGAIGPEYLQRCLGDHADHPLSICAHVAPGLSTCESRAAMIARPADATLWVAGGTPCSRPFKELKLVPEKTRAAPTLRAAS